MRQHSYVHASHSAHPATRMVDQYGVYHEPPRCSVNFHEPHNDRYRESGVGPEYHDTHITYTDPLRAERIPYNDDDGFIPQRAQVYRAGVVVNASGNSSVVRTQQNTYAAQNNTHSTQNNSHSAHNSSHGTQEMQNAQTNAQQAQTRNEETETENAFCCGCKGERKSASSAANASGNPASLWAIWCRPTILLLMLVLVASVFVLASGIMLYYHCMYHNIACNL